MMRGVITEMYDRMDAGDVVVKPYPYLIHPFPDGTLPHHRLRLAEGKPADFTGSGELPGDACTVADGAGRRWENAWWVPGRNWWDRGGHYILHTKDVVCRWNTRRERFTIRRSVGIQYRSSCP